MPTLMMRDTFQIIVDARQRLVAEGYERGGCPGGTFVPWAGQRLKSDRGIYMVGIAVDAEPVTGRQTFEARLRWTEDICANGRHNRERSPFWRFLDGMTQELFHGRYYETADRWGWSNLLKICWSKGAPGTWPPEFISAQTDTCAVSLRQEFSKLQKSVIFIGSNTDFGILHSIFGERQLWNREYEKEAGIWWLQDDTSCNLYVHGYHPAHARRRRFFDAALGRTLELARNHLPAFC
jgi:hypothetical protein